MMHDDVSFPQDEDWRGEDLAALVDAAEDGNDEASEAVDAITTDLATLVALYRGVASRLRREGADAGRMAEIDGHGRFVSL